MDQEINHAERAHAEFSPSQLKNLKQCAGYQGRSGTSEASEMGTRIHEALEIRDPSNLRSEKEIDIYDASITEEENLLVNAFGDKEYTLIREERLVIKIDAKSEMFGTADIIATSGDVALIADYKTGISEIDEPLENWQAKAYALGVFQKYQDIQFIHFAFIVPQRREVPYGMFERDRDMINLRNEISEVVRAAESTRPKWADNAIDIDDVTPSVNTCRFCRFEDTCPALGAISIEIARKYKPSLMPEGDIHVSNVEDPETLAKMYIVAKIVEDWASHVKFKVQTLSNQGVEFPYLKRRSLGARNTVKDSSGVAQYAMANGMELYDVFEASNISISKLADKFSANAPRGSKSKVHDEFINDLIDNGFVEKGEVNYTLTIVK